MEEVTDTELDIEPTKKKQKREEINVNHCIFCCEPFNATNGKGGAVKPDLTKIDTLFWCM